MFAIDTADPTPIYAQLERSIRVAVSSGRLKVGDRLPTVRQLAVELRVNANTVAKVYGELERVGLLGTRRGVGTFVRGALPDEVPDQERRRRLTALADRFLDDASALGYSPEEALSLARLRASERGTSDASGE